MIRFLLFGIVAVAMFIIAPQVGASRSVKVQPGQASPSLITRTIFEAENIEGEDVVDRRQENLEDGKVEERRDDARQWAEEQEE